MNLTNNVKNVIINVENALETPIRVLLVLILLIEEILMIHVTVLIDILMKVVKIVFNANIHAKIVQT